MSSEIVNGELIKNDRINLRLTATDDIDYVIKTESHPDNLSFIFQWNEDQHQAVIGSDDMLHIIIEENETKKRLGYMIISQVKNKNKSIELMRIAISDKNLGYGTSAIQLFLDYGFNSLDAHRIWLDVKEYNYSAINLYKFLGFVQEGILRECVLYDGRFDSMIVMSMLKKEYLSKTK